MKVVKVICALLICGFVSVSHAGILKLNVENGILTGADNVSVNGSLYNVRFLDGTCIDLFNGCDEDSDFLFNSEATAGAAADALFAQVFEGGQFLTSWTLIAGCGSEELCSIYTPHGSVATGTPFGEVMSCRLSIFKDGVFRGGCLDTGLNGPDADFGVFDYYVYAVWTEAVEASAPGTAMILLMGIAGLLVSHRRKQA
jgi:hypothetical protein